MHLWRLLSYSPSLSMNTSENGVGEHTWQLAPMGLSRGSEDEWLLVAQGWNPSPVTWQTPDTDFSIRSHMN